MKCTKNAILHDRWNHAGTYYLGISASYIRRKVIWENNKNICINEHFMPLLSMSPQKKSTYMTMKVMKLLTLELKIKLKTLLKCFSFMKLMRRSGFYA